MAQHEIAIVGGGLAGRIAALAFAREGFDTALITPEDGRSDQRTTALMDQSIAFLRTLGLWDKVQPEDLTLARLHPLTLHNTSFGHQASRRAWAGNKPGTFRFCSERP